MRIFFLMTKQIHNCKTYFFYAKQSCISYEPIFYRSPQHIYDFSQIPRRFAELKHLTLGGAKFGIEYVSASLGVKPLSLEGVRMIGLNSLPIYHLCQVVLVPNCEINKWSEHSHFRLRKSLFPATFHNKTDATPQLSIIPRR